MGYYTKLTISFSLKKDTPAPIIDLLKRVIIDKDLGVRRQVFKRDDVFVPEVYHDFFKCQNWYMLFLSTNWDNDMKGGSMFLDGKYWRISLDTEFKNYDNETELFLEWITPFVAGRRKKQYIGWQKGESQDCRQNIYITR